MKYEINSANITFTGRDFVIFFECINEACNHFGINYFVVGAFARDILLKNIFNQPTGLATQDIDIAIQLDTWDKYQDFTKCLKTNYGFNMERNDYTFISPEGVLTDILPYGEIESERKISFPPFSRVINMFGFEEVSDTCLVIRLDDKIDIKIASIEGIAILKLIAWKDRKPEKVSEKHVKDIALIINAYFAATAEYINKSTTLIDELTTLFEHILKNKDNSLFAGQLAISMNRDYEFCYELIEGLAKGFQEFIDNDLS